MLICRSGKTVDERSDGFFAGAGKKCPVYSRLVRQEFHCRADGFVAEYHGRIQRNGSQTGIIVTNIRRFSFYREFLQHIVFTAVP